MTRRRWIADEVSGNRAALIGSHADHLSRVLRARIGQEFDIATGTGSAAAASPPSIPTVWNSNSEKRFQRRVSPRVTLALSIFKFDRMEWAIEKCTELGVPASSP